MFTISENLDILLDLNSELNIYKLTGITELDGNIVSQIRDHIALVTTCLSIIMEQFLWCPLVFSVFEIPVSTLLNGGSFSTIPKEVDSKLNVLLINNAKVWTLANIVIFNVPVEWRPLASNCVDILWQSILSDVAADCGKVKDDVCEVSLVVEKDYAYFAEKSRI